LPRRISVFLDEAARDRLIARFGAARQVALEVDVRY
jgi:hypothetical protein